MHLRFGRWLFFALAIFALSGAAIGSTSAQTPDSAGTDLERTLPFDGSNRTYLVHIPTSAAPASGFPLLIMLHGGTGNGNHMARLSGFSELADREGFIVAYPDGTSRVENRYTWNAYGCCGFAQRENVDDVGFIGALIDQMVADDGVDPSRVYVSGYSNGAMMTFRIACELSGKIAAAAPYAGSLNTDSCSADQPVPILIMNGEDDVNVPVAGGTSDERGAASQRDRVDKPTSFAVDTWVTLDGCPTPPQSTNTSVATTTIYANCANGTMVEQILIHGWDHRWPSAENGSSIDAATTIWNFVSQFSNPGATASNQHAKALLPAAS